MALASHRASSKHYLAAFFPTGVAVGGLSAYLLDGLFAALRGSTMTLMFTLLAIALVMFVLFSASLSVVLDRLTVSVKAKNHLISKRD